MSRQTLLVLFGGQSSEHEISCLSAANVVRNVDTDRYDLCLVGITKEGRWLHTDVPALLDGSWQKSTARAVLSPDATEKCVYVAENGTVRRRRIDVAFPVLHGLYGEDGTVQGIFTLAGIPYVGCGVLSSAATMDKVFTKMIVERLGIRQAAWVGVYRNELENGMDHVIQRIESALPYPVFVKPSCAGSSVGVSRADDREGLIKALWIAAKEDGKILVEERIDGREIECAVLGTDTDAVASGVGEILAAADFYDYDAKYNNEDSRTVVDPELPEGVAEEIRRDALSVFRALDCFSLSRVDFFLDAKGVVFNEINTIPGFTAISMYPMLFGRAGLSYPELVQKLIDTAFLRKEH